MEKEKLMTVQQITGELNILKDELSVNICTIYR